MKRRRKGNVIEEIGCDKQKKVTGRLKHDNHVTGCDRDYRL
jgi:hypothetical protein